MTPNLGFEPLVERRALHKILPHLRTYNDFTTRGCRINVDSSFKSDNVHFAWIPSSPGMSLQLHPPVQLFTTALVAKIARKITTAKRSKDNCAI